MLLTVQAAPDASGSVDNLDYTVRSDEVQTPIAGEPHGHRTLIRSHGLRLLDQARQRIEHEPDLTLDEGTADETTATFQVASDTLTVNDGTLSIVAERTS